jgi:hypothetical protein
VEYEARETVVKKDGTLSERGGVKLETSEKKWRRKRKGMLDENE